MGVSFYICARCNSTFPDCGEYIRCSCGRKWCWDDCAKKDGWHYDEKTGDDEIDFDDYERESSSCNFCLRIDATDDKLFKFALEELNSTRSEILKRYLLSIAEKKNTKGS